PSGSAGASAGSGSSRSARTVRTPATGPSTGRSPLAPSRAGGSAPRVERAQRGVLVLGAELGERGGVEREPPALDGFEVEGAGQQHAQAVAVPEERDLAVRRPHPLEDPPHAPGDV